MVDRVEPTDAQRGWLWEQCGQVTTRRVPASEPGYFADRVSYPPIDLNNLFRYEPLTARGYHIVSDTYKREIAGTMGQCSWAKIIDPSGNIVSCFAMRELKDALFWALYKALGGK